MLGKSYVGELVMQALLVNGRPSHGVEEWTVDEGQRMRRRPADAAKLAITPILCICYTNHAVDAFLEGLIDRGGVALNEVVRVGSRSKSERLNGRSLAVLSNSSGSGHRSRQENARYRALKVEAEV